MEQWLVQLVILGVFLLVALAIIQWMGWTISPLVWRIGGIIIGGIVLVFLIRFLWPVLVSGQLPSLR